MPIRNLALFITATLGLTLIPGFIARFLPTGPPKPGDRPPDVRRRGYLPERARHRRTPLS